MLIQVGSGALELKDQMKYVGSKVSTADWTEL